MVLRLVTGDDAVLLGEAVSRLIDVLVAGGDRSLVLEQLTESDLRTEDGEWDPSRLVDAARTPPFLTDRRVVVGRHLMRFPTKDEYAPLVELASDLLPTTDLVLVWERGLDPKMDRSKNLPKALKDAVEAAGGEILATALPTRGRAASDWLRDTVPSGLQRGVVGHHLGENGGEDCQLLFAYALREPSVVCLHAPVKLQRQRLPLFGQRQHHDAPVAAPAPPAHQTHAHHLRHDAAYAGDVDRQSLRQLRSGPLFPFQKESEQGEVQRYEPVGRCQLRHAPGHCVYLARHVFPQNG